MYNSKCMGICLYSACDIYSCLKGAKVCEKLIEKIQYFPSTAKLLHGKYKMKNRVSLYNGWVIKSDQSLFVP